MFTSELSVYVPKRTIVFGRLSENNKEVCSGLPGNPLLNPLIEKFRVCLVVQVVSSIESIIMDHLLDINHQTYMNSDFEYLKVAFYLVNRTVLWRCFVQRCAE